MRQGLFLFSSDRARAVYLDHMTRLEGVTQGVVTNGGISERMGDGLVSRGVGLEGVVKDVGMRSGGVSVSQGVVRRRDGVKDGGGRAKKPRLLTSNTVSITQVNALTLNVLSLTSG